VTHVEINPCYLKIEPIDNQSEKIIWMRPGPVLGWRVDYKIIDL